MAKNKYTLATIIILLVLSVACSVYGTFMYFTTVKNAKHQFKYGNKLYFYDNDKLLGTFTCEVNTCDYAIYKNELKSNMINQKYAFIQANNKVKLYNIKEEKVIDSFDSVDNSDNIYLVKKDDSWGAITLDNDVMYIMDIKYQDIMYKNGTFAVYDEVNYKIIKDNSEIFTSDNKIKDFNDNYVVTTINGIAPYDVLSDYNNKLYFLNDEINEEIYLVENYFVIKRQTTYYIYKIDNQNEVLVDSFVYEGDVKITYTVEENSINLYTGTDLKKTIELGS